MRIVRELERRLESLLDDVTGRVFRGPLHPSELAGKLIRTADLSSTDTAGGPTVANHFVLTANPADLGEARVPGPVTAELARLLEEAAVERGWRMEGPAEVEIHPDPGEPRGRIGCRGEVQPGLRPAWARLRGADVLDLTVNRALVGRGRGADVTIDDDRVSRAHARLWQEAGRIRLADLGSANGTRVDGVQVTTPVDLRDGSVLTFGPATYRIEVL